MSKEVVGILVYANTYVAGEEHRARRLEVMNAHMSRERSRMRGVYL